MHKRLAEKPPSALNGYDGRTQACDISQNGGHGVSVMYETRTSANLSVGYTRAKVPVWSLNGKQAGGTNSMIIKRASGEHEAHQFASGVTLLEGDRVLIETACGGNS